MYNKVAVSKNKNNITNSKEMEIFEGLNDVEPEDIERASSEKIDTSNSTFTYNNENLLDEDIIIDLSKNGLKKKRVIKYISIAACFALISTVAIISSKNNNSIITDKNQSLNLNVLRDEELIEKIEKDKVEKIINSAISFIPLKLINEDLENSKTLQFTVASMLNSVDKFYPHSKQPQSFSSHSDSIFDTYKFYIESDAVSDVMKKILGVDTTTEELLKLDGFKKVNFDNKNYLVYDSSDNLSISSLLKDKDIKASGNKVNAQMLYKYTYLLVDEDGYNKLDESIKSKITIDSSNYLLSSKVNVVLEKTDSIFLGYKLTSIKVDLQDK